MILKRIIIDYFNSEDGVLNGMIDISGDNFDYADIGTHHGLQCEVEGDHPEHDRKMKLLSNIAKNIKEFYRLY